MQESGLVCLKLKHFDNYSKTTWQTLKYQSVFTDVTLVCQNKKIEAHKVILAASSPVLKNILVKNSSRTYFLYLVGVNYEELECMLDLIYIGETTILKERLDDFLTIAEDFGIDDLTINRNMKKKLKQTHEIKYEHTLCTSKEEVIDHDVNDETDIEDENNEIQNVSTLPHSLNYDNELKCKNDMKSPEYDQLTLSLGNLSTSPNKNKKPNGNVENQTPIDLPFVRDLTQDVSKKRDFNPENSVKSVRKPYSCKEHGECKFTARDNFALRNHRRAKHEKGSFACSKSWCDAVMDTMIEKEIHVKNCAITCKVCGKTFNRGDKWTIHDNYEKSRTTVCYYDGNSAGLLQMKNDIPMVDG